MAYPDLANGEIALRADNTAGISGPLAGANKLWLSIWSGETIHAYDAYNMFESLVDSRTINNGVSMEFPITGTVALEAAWNAGVELYGGSSSSTTVAIKLDKRPIAAHFELDNVDLMQTQWEYRSELARQAGLTLANARDKQIAAYIARAGVEDLNWVGNATAGTYTPATDVRGVPTAPVFLSVNFKYLGAHITPAATTAQRTDAALDALKACEDFLVYLQTINAPVDGVYLAVTPRAFQDIRALGVARSGTPTFVERPFFGGVAEAGGLGAALTAGMNNLMDSLEYMGVTIIKSNHLPISNYGAGAIGEARYNLSFGDAGIVGLIFQKSAVASLKLQGLKVDTVDDVRRNTTFTVASMMSGTGVLRPECAAVLVGQTTPNDAAAFSKGTGTLFNTTGGVPFAEVDAANVGGSEAAAARNELRVLLGANFSREFIPTAPTTATTGFPYSA
jgi:hypothetical protein